MDISKLISEMTVKEKAAQLTMLTANQLKEDISTVITGTSEDITASREELSALGFVLGTVGAEAVKKLQTEYLMKSRLKIPLIFAFDVIHGFRTIFPIPLALGATFNPYYAEECAKIAAAEASAAGVMLNFSPMVDLVRDPRWGRVSESTGEDPYLNALFARAFVKGYQHNGDLTSYGSIASCVKHFAGYGAVEAGRDYNTADLSEYTFRDMHLPSFKAAINEGCCAVMPAFNTINGIPCHASKQLLKNILRGELGFDGTVVSDWAGVGQVIDHGAAKNISDAARRAIEAGVDVDTATSSYISLANQLEQSSLLDEQVYRVLRLKDKLGLFENPYRYADETKEKTIMLTPQHRAAAKAAALAAVVMLKNDDKTLPLDFAGKRILLTGPYADSSDLLGSWSCLGRASDTVTLKDGLSQIVGANAFAVLKGCGYGALDNDFSEEEFTGAVNEMNKSDIIIAAVGEHPLQSGESRSRGFLELPECQLKLLENAFSSGKKVIVVIFAGRPLIISDIVKKASAVLYAWFPGTEGGSAIADIICGLRSPEGRLPISFPFAVGQIPVYYNHLNTGRPKPCDDRYYEFTSTYIDIPNKPLFPFGYGLTYSEVDYSCTKAAIDGDIITFSCTIKNIGANKITETAQLYIKDIVGSRARPVRELKGVKKVTLEPGAEMKISYILTREDFAFTTESGAFTYENGEFLAIIAKDSSICDGGAEFVLD